HRLKHAGMTEFGLLFYFKRQAARNEPRRDPTRNLKPIYFPFHTGARFSANARGPSLLSSVMPTRADRSASSRRPSSNGSSMPFLIASLMNATDIGAPLRILFAKFSAA